MSQSPASAAVHESYSRQEGLSCSVCHVAPDGGALTLLGREYLWSGRAHAVDEREQDRLGQWSGDWTNWLRSSRERVRGESSPQQSLTSSLRLHGSELFGSPRWSFDGDAWGRSNHSSDREGFDDDRVSLTQATLQWMSDDAGTSVRGGRQWVSSGVTSRRLDGLSMQHGLNDHFVLTLFGGVPSENAEGGSAGDLLLGGRLGYRNGRSLQLGLSSFYAKDDGDPADLKIGADLYASPHETLDLSAFAFHDWIGGELYDSRLLAVWKPSLRWQCSAGWSRTIPGLFLPKNSIFSVFSDDAYQEFSATLTRRFNARLSAHVFERLTRYDGGEQVRAFGAGMDVRYGPGGEDSVGFELSYHDEERTANAAGNVDGDALFTRAYHRLFWRSDLYTLVDGSLSVYSGSPFARDSHVVRGLVGWYATERTELQVGAEYLRNPEFSDRIDLLARYTVRF